MNFHKFKGEVKKQIESIAKRRIKTIRYDGYSGHFVTFGKPFVRQGDTIQLVDDYVTERNGYFKVKQVDYSFGDSGFRQKIYLHAKDKTVS